MKPQISFSPTRRCSPAMPKAPVQLRALPLGTTAILASFACGCALAPAANAKTEVKGGSAPVRSNLAKTIVGSKTPSLNTATPAISSSKETLGGGTVWTPAIGPAPSFGLGGTGMVLVKNWKFGANGTIRNYTEMSENFLYHDQFGTINNGGKYGANMVSPDFANSVGGQPIEGVDSPPVRQFTADSLKTFLTPLNKVTDVQVRNHNTGNGSFVAKWRLPNGGSLLGRDIVWETRVRFVPPPYFWFAIWTAGNRWQWDGHNGQGAEQDLVEAFGYDNGNGNTNYDGRFFHSNAVASPSKDDWNFWDWEGTMKDKGVKSFDASQYHTWTWVYKKDNTYAMYVDGIRVQGGKDYYWTYGNKKDDEPIDMDFLFDASWGHQQIGSVNKELPASALQGKFYEWDYSRVYLSDGVGDVKGGTHILPGTVKAADFNTGAKGVAFDQMPNGGGWHNVTVQVPMGGSYKFAFDVTAPQSGGTFHVEDEKGAKLVDTLTVPKTGRKAVTVSAPAPVVLSGGAHVLKVVQDSPGLSIASLSAAPVAGASATFVRIDAKTSGNWKGVYGSEGYLIGGDASHGTSATKQPTYGKAEVKTWTFPWSNDTDDGRALQKEGGGNRVAGQWGSNDPTYDIDVNFSDTATHQVAIYGLDWDRQGRLAAIEVVDAASGKLLDSHEISAYAGGKYLIWNIRGHVILRVRKFGDWTNSAMSGLFFDPVAGAKAAK